MIGGRRHAARAARLRDDRPDARRPTPTARTARTTTPITIRVRAVAHYGGAIGDVRGELRLTNDEHDDPDLLPGFPHDLGASGEASPKLADIDGDGIRDIVDPAPPTARSTSHDEERQGPAEVAGLPLHDRLIDGLNPTPDRHAELPLAPPAYTTRTGVDPDLAREAIVAAPAIGDLDGDGKLEIVFATWAGTIYVVKNEARVLAGLAEAPAARAVVPARITPKPGGKPCMDDQTRIARGTYGAPVLVDMDKDGKLEIVQAAFDGNIYVFQADGTPLDGWPVAVHTKATRRRQRRVRPHHDDADGHRPQRRRHPRHARRLERDVGGGGAGAFFAVDGRGTKLGPKPYLPNWPLTTTSLKLFPVVAEGVLAASRPTSTATASEVVVQGNGARRSS